MSSIRALVLPSSALPAAASSATSLLMAAVSVATVPEKDSPVTVLLDIHDGSAFCCAIFSLRSRSASFSTSDGPADVEMFTAMDCGPVFVRPLTAMGLFAPTSTGIVAAR